MHDDTPLGPVAPLSGLCRMTVERAQRGYPLTRFLCSLRDAGRREALVNDLEGCLRESGLGELEKDMLRRRDYIAMLEHGAAVVAVANACRGWGVSLVELGALGRGQSPEDFISARKRANQGKAWEF